MIESECERHLNVAVVVTDGYRSNRYLVTPDCRGSILVTTDVMGEVDVDSG
jgi:hypothetical protein